MAESPEQNVALLIDWDNLAISIAADMGGATPDVKRIVQKAQEYGRILIARAYAEWNTMSERLSVYRAGVEPVYAPTFRFENDPFTQAPRGKSLADPVMVTDAIDTLHIMPQITTLVLVTGDKDLIPVVRLAQLRARKVVVIGPDLVAGVLRDMADDFVSYRSLVAGDGVEAAIQAPPAARGREPLAPARRQPARPVVVAKPAPPPAAVRPPVVAVPRPAQVPEETAPAEGPDLQTIFTSLVEILQQMAGTGRVRVRATNLKDQLLVRVPGFSERKYGFSKFKDLLLAAERSALVSVSAAGPVHWVSLPSPEAPAAEETATELPPTAEPVAVATVSPIEEAEEAEKGRERRVIVVRFIDELRARSRWLTYTYVLTNVIGFIGRLVPADKAEAEARSILNYLVSEGALSIDKAPQEVDVGGIKHRVRMCHFVEEHPLVREARALTTDQLPAELAAELSPAGEAVPTGAFEVMPESRAADERAPLEQQETLAGEPSLELGQVSVSPEELAAISGNGRVAEDISVAEQPTPSESAPEAEEPVSRSRRRGRRGRSAGARQAAQEPAALEPESSEVQPEAVVETMPADPAPPVAAEAPEMEPRGTEESSAPPAPPERPSREAVFAEARSILEDLSRQGKERVTGSSLKLRLGRRFSGFDERQYGYSKFKDFLQEAEREGYATLEMEGQVSWVRPPRPQGEAQSVANEETQPTSAGEGETPAGEGSADAAPPEDSSGEAGSER